MKSQIYLRITVHAVTVPSRRASPSKNLSKTTWHLVTLKGYHTKQSTSPQLYRYRGETLPIGHQSRQSTSLVWWVWLKKVLKIMYKRKEKALSHQVRGVRRCQRGRQHQQRVAMARDMCTTSIKVRFEVKIDHLYTRNMHICFGVISEDVQQQSHVNQQGQNRQV